MTEQELDRLGRRLRDAVDRAVERQDFKELEQDIRRVVDRTVQRFQGKNTIVDQTRPQELAKLYRNPSRLNGRAARQLVIGLPVLSFSMILLFDGQLGGSPIWGIPSQVLIMGLLALAGGVLTFLGCRTMSMLERFKKYRGSLGFGTYCSVGVLANEVGKTVEFVRRDLKRMIRKGLFLQGHLNKEGTYLLTSNETYAYYEQSRLQLEERQRQEEASRKAKEAVKQADPKVQEVLDRGAAFIAQIRKCNDDIPGQEISAKIDRMEHIVRRIFQRVESHPEVVPDLKKLMEYYLPMAVKLLQAYAEMDAQPVQGENIRSTKAQIDATLDTLNLAFEKLLDQIFGDTAMDVSSDISVLNTLLAQDGLTEDDFKGG